MRRMNTPGRPEGLCTGRVHWVLSRKLGAAGGVLFTPQTHRVGFRRLGPGEVGFRQRNVKLDWLPMNGGPEKGQW